VFRDEAQIEHAGKVNNLLVTWLKAWELDTLRDFEKRLAALEKDRLEELEPILAEALATLEGFKPSGLLPLDMERGSARPGMITRERAAGMMA